jgi:hypothetical protein
VLQTWVSTKVILGSGDRDRMMDSEYGTGSSRPLLDMTF